MACSHMHSHVFSINSVCCDKFLPYPPVDVEFVQFRTDAGVLGCHNFSNGVQDPVVCWMKGARKSGRVQLQSLPERVKQKFVRMARPVLDFSNVPTLSQHSFNTLNAHPPSLDAGARILCSLSPASDSVIVAYWRHLPVAWI
jgi:hypothetical protein